MSAASQPQPTNGLPSTRPSTERETVYIWRPQVGPQKALIDCPLPEIFFGGARGGGKTDGVLGKWALKEKRYGRNFNARMFRKTTVSSEDAIERSKEIYGPLGGKFHEQAKLWRMPNGGRIGFAYLDSVADADGQQGKNLTDVWVEEAGQYPSPAPIDKLFGALRSAHGVPVQMIVTANPGGAGQHWLRARYELHPFPRAPRMLIRKLPNGTLHRVAVIPSRIGDNRILMLRDPGYVGRLHLVGSAELVRAWLEGDWTAIEGAFFDCWRESRNIVTPFQIPADWLRFRSGDWGSAAPFSIGWWAVVGDDHKLAAETPAAGEPAKRYDGTLPRGAMVRYREWYGASGPNVGLRLTAAQVGDGIAEREANDPKLSFGVLDPSTFKEDGGPSIAERINDVLLAKRLIGFHHADNARVAQRGAMGGWDQMRDRMTGTGDRPMLVTFATCTDSIRTIPVLQHDPNRAEDLDTHTEDHAADEWRYACMSRPWVKSRPKTDADKPDAYGSADDVERVSMATI